VVVVGTTTSHRLGVRLAGGWSPVYDRIRLDWRVPAEEWKRFRRHVEDEYGSLGGYLGREAEAAMQEYADADGYARIEERIDRLVEAAGRRPGAASKEKKSDLANAETTRVTVKVESEVKDEFRAVADQSENTFGVEFARAIRAYRDGGRAARLERKLDRVLDDAAGLLAETTDSDTDESLSLVERKTIAIANELGEEFTDDELVNAIVDVAEVDSDPSIEKYRTRVTEKKDVEPHPNASHLWIPAEKAARLSPGEPEECRQPVDQLDRQDRVRRIQLAVGRRAACRSNGRVRVETRDIREHVLDSEVSKSNTLDLMRSAARAVGIDVDDSTRPAALKVNLNTLGETEPDLTRDVLEYRDETEDGLLSAPTSTTLRDHMDGPSASSGASESVATDGGEDW
jgi:hypothetical protein